MPGSFSLSEPYADKNRFLFNEQEGSQILPSQLLSCD